MTHRKPTAFSTFIFMVCISQSFLVSTSMAKMAAAPPSPKTSGFINAVPSKCKMKPGKDTCRVTVLWSSNAPIADTAVYLNDQKLWTGKAGSKYFEGVQAGQKYEFQLRNKADVLSRIQVSGESNNGLTPPVKAGTPPPQAKTEPTPSIQLPHSTPITQMTPMPPVMRGDPPQTDATPCTCEVTKKAWLFYIQDQVYMTKCGFDPYGEPRQRTLPNSTFSTQEACEKARTEYANQFMGKCTDTGGPSGESKILAVHSCVETTVFAGTTTDCAKCAH
jgi:hypothetical protein